MVRRGKFGRFVGCDKYPDCKTIVNVPKTGILKFTGKVDDETGFPIIEAGTGRKKATVTLAENKKDDTPVEKKYPEQDMVCPTCKEGKMILRKSFYGEFLGCSGYPKCQTMMKIVKGVVDVANPIVKKPGDKKKKVVKKKVAKKKKVKK